MTARATARPVARRTAHTAVHPAPHGTGRRFAHTADGAGGAGWRASSYSNAEGGNCVEVAHGAGGQGVVPVRDSKRPRGPALLFEPGAWSSFVEALKGRIGPDHAQLPPDRAHSQADPCARGGPMRFEPPPTARPYAPNS